MRAYQEAHTRPVPAHSPVSPPVLGENPNHIKDVLGHTRITTTKIYAHTNATRAKNTANNVAEAILGVIIGLFLITFFVTILIIHQSSHKDF